MQSWPTIYVLDGTGKIRFKNVRGEAMDKAVDELLKEMESEGGPTTQPIEKASGREFLPIRTIKYSFYQFGAQWRPSKTAGYQTTGLAVD